MMPEPEVQMENWKNFLQQVEVLSKKARRWTITRKELDEVRKAILEEPFSTWKYSDIKKKVKLSRFMLNKAISILQKNGEIRSKSKRYWETVEVKYEDGNQ